MRQFLLGGLVGGIIFFVWGAIAWTVLPFNSNALHTPMNEDAVLAALKQSMGGRGMYALPAMPRKEGLTADHYDALQKTWAEKYKAGPTALVMYNPHGSDQMRVDQLLFGLANSILCALLGVWFLIRSTAYTSSYFARVTFFGMFGVLISFFIHLSNFNWFDYPADYTVAMVLDSLLGWVLAGLGAGAIVKAPQT
ncbi:MAG: hypothetical protein WB699_12290 [Bacteroidota bacterium]